jgi:ubiquinone/menaquinone biosynthesis C-methylase UbiE
MLPDRHIFSLDSGDYLLARPRYPSALFAWLAENSLTRDLAWDCATGNGQAAVDLAQYFKQVYASDISDQQILNSVSISNVNYSVQVAENTSFSDSMFDLITVAQALHWFNFERFWQEIQRVAKPNALFCAWGYSLFDCDSEVLNEFVLPIRKLIETFWAVNNQILWDAYPKDLIKFPFNSIEMPSFRIEGSWTISQMDKYIQTWSAYKLATKDKTIAKEIQSISSYALLKFQNKGSIEFSMPLTSIAGFVNPT